MTSRFPWTFRPRIATTAAAVAFCVLSVSLGNWQLRRAVEKEADQAQREARTRAAPVTLPGRSIDGGEWDRRRVAVRGQFVGERGILIDNRTRAGRAGYEVVMPLRIEGSDLYVLVNRGWVAQGPSRDRLPAPITPSGPVQVEGMAVIPPVHVFELGESAPSSRVWPHLDLARYRAWSGLEIQSVVVLQTGETIVGNDGAQGDGLLRQWPSAESGAAKHRAYALQWYIFAFLTVILYVALNLGRSRPS